MKRRSLLKTVALSALSMPENRTVTKSRPQLALLVETSMASGRQIVRGLSRYAREYGPWACFVSRTTCNGYWKHVAAPEYRCPKGRRFWEATATNAAPATSD